MGRIISQVYIENLREPSKSLHLDALVDTGSAYMVLPSAWKERLGALDLIREVEIETATHARQMAKIYGPVKLQLSGFAPIYSEVLFLDMQAENDDFEPLIGYIPLEQSQVAVDMLGHRLIKVKYVDLKKVA